MALLHIYFYLSWGQRFLFEVVMEFSIDRKGPLFPVEAKAFTPSYILAMMTLEISIVLLAYYM